MLQTRVLPNLSNYSLAMYQLTYIKSGYSKHHMVQTPASAHFSTPPLIICLREDVIKPAHPTSKAGRNVDQR